MLSLLQSAAFDAVAAAVAKADLTSVLAAAIIALLLVVLLRPSRPSPALTSSSSASELRSLTDTVRLLVDAQQRQTQTHQNLGQSQSISSSVLAASRSSFFHDDALKSPSSRSPMLPANISSPTMSGAAVPFDLVADMKQQQEYIKNLERKNRELMRQQTLQEVSNVVDVEKKYRRPIPVAGEDGTSQINLSASEIETIRAIFNMFDSEQTGKVSTRELQSLHKQLGEPLTEEEASAAVSELDPAGTGEVNFNKFLIWWYHAHENTKGSAYTQRFKLVHAKLTTSNFDLDKIVTQDSGEIYTLEYRLNYYYKGHNQSLRPISPWHDIPLNRIGSGEQGQLFNFVCEIPKWTRAKFECATGEPYNPIKQDTQHGKLRYYKHGDMMFNYGFFPQTWEDPEVIPDDTGFPGDNDPVDCVEIGATQIRVGAIAAVKVLGLLGLIDDGETDWKIIAISIADPMAHLLNDVDDVEVHLPGAIKAIREYFRDYKSFSGKINTYALRAQAMPRHYAVHVLEETHQHWKSLQAKQAAAGKDEKLRGVIGESNLQTAGRATVPASVSPSPTAVGVSGTTGMEQPLDKLMEGK